MIPVKKKNHFQGTEQHPTHYSNSYFPFSPVIFFFFFAQPESSATPDEIIPLVVSMLINVVASTCILFDREKVQEHFL